MLDSVIVKKSLISGKGVFANRDFVKGEKVIDWKICSKILSDLEVSSLSKKQKIFLSKVGGKNIYFLAPARFVNHSCDANTKAIGFADVAVCDIKKGEEITADYNKELWEGNRIKCLCKSKNCKGFIGKA